MPAGICGIRLMMKGEDFSRNKKLLTHAIIADENYFFNISSKDFERTDAGFARIFDGIFGKKNENAGHLTECPVSVCHGKFSPVLKYRYTGFEKHRKRQVFRRYWPGVTPSSFLNTRIRTQRLEKPTRTATSSRVKTVSRSSFFAASVRT